MIPETARLRAVLVNYNGGDLLQRAVSSVLECDWSGPIDVVVVDNASTDGSLDALQALDVTIVHRPTNEGFAANNHALTDLLLDLDPHLDEAGGSALDLDAPTAVLLLNPDAAIRPETPRLLAEALDGARRIGCAAPKVLFDQPFIELGVGSGDLTITSVRVADADVTSRCHGIDGAFRLPGVERPIWRCPAGSTVRVPLLQLGDTVELDTARASNGVVDGIVVEGAATVVLDTHARRALQVVQNAGSALSDDGFGLNRGFTAIEGATRFDERVGAWCGAAVVLHPDYLRDVGGFDPAYFLYYEDTDLSMRGLARGWSTRYVDAALVEHRHSDRAVQGTKLVEVLQHRNRLVMLARNAPLRMAIGAYVRALLTPLSLLGSAVGSPAGVGPSLRLARWRARAVLEATARFPAAIRARRRINATRRVSAKRVFAEAIGRT